MGRANGLEFIPNTKGQQLPVNFIIRYLKQYPADAANLGWMKRPPTIFELKSNHGKVSKELKQVFTYKD